MMTEEHPAVRRDKVGAVLKTMRRGPSRIVQLEHAPRDETPVESVGQHIETDSGDDQPETIDLLDGIEDAGHDGQCGRACNGNRHPSNSSHDGHCHDATRTTQRCKSENA